MIRLSQDADLSIVRSKNGEDSGRLPQRNEPQFWVRESELHPLPVSVMREIINVQVGQCGNQIGYKVVKCCATNLRVATKMLVALSLLSVGQFTRHNRVCLVLP